MSASEVRPSGLVHRRMGRICGVAVNFLGRIANIVVLVLLLRYVGLGSDVAPLLLAMSLYSFTVTVLAGPLEMQALADFRRFRRPHALTASSIALGLALALVVVVAAYGVHFVMPLVQEALTYLLILMAGVPFAAAFAAMQGVLIGKDRWMLPGLLSVVRSAVVVSAVAVGVPYSGLIVVPLAMVAGDLLRFCMAAVIDGQRYLTVTVDRSWLRMVARQLPASALGCITPAISRLLLVGLSLGSIALLDLADRAVGLLILSFTQGLLPVLYQRWSRIPEPRRQFDVLRRSAVRIAAGAGLISLLAAMALPPVVSAVADVSGSADRQVLHATIYALLIGFPGYAASQVYVRLFILTRLQDWLNFTAACATSVSLLGVVILGTWMGTPGVAGGIAAGWWTALVAGAAVARWRVAIVGGATDLEPSK